MIVRELMSRHVEWTTPSTTLADAARMLNQSVALKPSVLSSS